MRACKNSKKNSGALAKRTAVPLTTQPSIKFTKYKYTVSNVDLEIYK